ncbi:MAG: recombinase family protein [Planctomycetes bacterium]|nr:recombinase family protein [Planctomycetota bacterium]
MKLTTRRTRRPAPEVVRLIGYSRVSTDEQVDKGVSLAAQRERLAAFAAAHGYSLLRVEEDAGVSGKLSPVRRPAMARALDAIRGGEADGLVALKLDRFSRSTRDTLALVEAAERAGWRLLSVSEALDTGSAAGRMVVTILAALAQMEREQIGERTAFGMDQIAREGRARSYHLPFGFRVQGSDSPTLRAGDRSPLVEDPAEQAILARMQALEANGLGARRIAKALEGEGSKNPRTGRPWSPALVAKILATAHRRAAVLSRAN